MVVVFETALFFVSNWRESEISTWPIPHITNTKTIIVAISNISNRLFPDVTVAGAGAGEVCASSIMLISRQDIVTVNFLCIKFCKNIQVFLIG
jgi:hypothetical protein